MGDDLGDVGEAVDESEAQVPDDFYEPPRMGADEGEMDPDGALRPSTPPTFGAAPDQPPQPTTPPQLRPEGAPPPPALVQHPHHGQMSIHRRRWQDAYRKVCEQLGNKVTPPPLSSSHYHRPTPLSMSKQFNSLRPFAIRHSRLDLNFVCALWKESGVSGEGSCNLCGVEEAEV